jgi:hypothetical protein
MLKIFRPKEEELTRGGDYVMRRRFIMYSLQKILG